MPTLHENRRGRFVLLGLLLAGCPWLATCGGNARRVDHPPPVPSPTRADAPQVATLPSTPGELSPELIPQGSEPIQAPTSSAPSPIPTLAAETASAEPAAPDALADAQTALRWEAMSAEERATHLQLDGLEFEAGRLSAEFAEPAAEEEAAEEPTLLEELSETPIPEDYSLAENRQEILRRTQSDLPLVLNAQVIKLINYFSAGRGLKTYKSTMGRGAAYQEMIERILREEDVPKELFHLAQAESGFLPKARSWARATGMWQFVSYRGRQYGLRQDRYLEERYDPEKATRAAARHLKDLYIEFDDWYLAMAAYNSGPERVRRAIRRSGSRDYWTLSERRLLPRETRNYIPIILAFNYVTKNQQLYDLGELDPAPPLRYATVTSRSEVSLDLLADLTDSTAATIRQLNPALLRSATPPFDYELRLPEGTAEQFRAQIASIPEDKRLKWRRHAVQEGETLAAIARQYRVREDDILALNGLDGEVLRAGRRLNIPAETRLEIYGGSGGRAGGFVEGGTGRYRIARGDTLGAIAARFGVSVARLMAWNGLTSTRIRAGRFLVVSSRDGGSRTTYAASSSSGRGSAPAGRYTVRRGDNLTAIATRYRVSVSDLRAWNGLRDSRIHAGQVLRVPGVSGSERAEAAPAGGQYRIRQGDNLAVIAQRFGVSVQDLQAWNGLRGSSIRAGESLRVAPVSRPVPQTANRAASAAPATAQPVAAVDGQRYRIRRGDNLAAIAQRFKVTIDQIKAWNSLRGSRITAGADLYVGPPSDGAGAAARPAPTAATATPPTAVITPSSGSKAQRYHVRRGDNLMEIARRFDVSVEDLKAWNGLRTSQITAGDYLTIRAGSAAPAGQYRIRRGDTLDSIAKRFGVTVDDLKAWNGLSNSRIHEGNYLTVRPEAENDSPQKLASIGG